MRRCRRPEAALEVPFAKHEEPRVGVLEGFDAVEILFEEVEQEIGFALPSAGYFELHWGHLKALLGGATELELCAAHDRQIQESGALSRLTRWTRAT